ncbi:DEAD/DEAH box helicase family protein [Mycolicibacterium austroafricanum]|uniref:DEAD/DEAH box helicase family protein n=1 Tax=Mycolicibacterium austroafricanum TaxID=39687 RepID=UPI001CA3371F|nr:DEAD/DEAH box helicase family protein [Mycolicibacterium austroafricanum]QZT59660.1 DEAD/DEAH box helicase family protein [Mycolicibacterium austroafricanum]
MLELHQFQETAAATVSSRVAEYLDNPAKVTVDRKLHVPPYFQSLSAITGAGKTAILAEAVAQIVASMPIKPIVMWLSKGKVVVQQTFDNLSERGKYHHLLDGMSVDALANYRPEVVTDAEQPLVYFATVGTFNQKDKEDGTLLIHKSDVDNMEASVWDQLRIRTDADGNRRPLVVVYDEAQNLSNQQTELLLELEPEVFLLASATMRLPARIGDEIQHLRTAGYAGDDDEYLVTKVKSTDVVSAGLVKDIVLLEGYNTPMEEAIAQLLADMAETTSEAKTLGLDFEPKSIYVCNTNVVADTPNQMDDPKQPFDQRQAPPILIWKYLVEQMGVDPSEVAVYADLKTNKDYPLPEEFTLFKGGDKDYDEFVAGAYKHIIFNLSLQEGWDDPSVYFAYIDKSMGSSAQITQVIGRVLRQPGTQHYPSDRLNAAHFYVRVDKNAVFNSVVEEVKAQLGTDPGGVKIVVSPPGKPKPKEYIPKGEYVVPETALNPSQAQNKIIDLLAGFTDYRGDDRNTKGAGSRRVLRQKVGQDGTETEWEVYEHSAEASARWVFHREIQRQFKEALGVVNLAEPKLDAVVGIGSPAYRHVTDLADDVVAAYVKGVRLVTRKSNPYKVGPVLARPDEVLAYKNAVHEGYSGLNSIERAFADEVDRVGLIWARNPPRSGYGIPLVTVGPTSNFYPDFLVWTEERVLCVDTKGPQLVDAAARRKLLTIKPSGEGKRLDIQFVSEGKYDDELTRRDSEGYTYWGLANDGSLNAVHFDVMDSLIKQLVDDAASLN